MKNDLILNIDKVHNTYLSNVRIIKNLRLNCLDSTLYVKCMILRANSIYKVGKNYYCIKNNMKFTINSYNYVIITAHYIK